MDPKKVYVEVKYEGQDISEKIKKYIESFFTYTDVASGSSDTISLTLNNSDKRWLGKWQPVEGDKVIATIITENWEKQGKEKKLVCGSFTVDDLSYTGTPRQAMIGALSAPADQEFSITEKSKTWKKVTVEQIAKEIAKNSKLKLYYEADKITIEEIEQNNQTDSSFLYAICEDYGLAMKAYYNKICIFDVETYEKKKVVCTIDESEMMPGYTLRSSITSSCTGATMKYTNKDGKTLTATVGKKGRMMNVTGKADNLKDAQLKAKAKLRAKNRDHVTISCTIIANIKVTAGSAVEITGFEKYDGKYYVDKVKHSIGGGYKMTLTLRLVELKSEIEKVSVMSISNSDSSAYILKKGDTLYALAKKYYGSVAKYKIIYDANQEVIEETAKKHGKQSSNQGYWIWPGTELTIPEV